MGYLAMAFTGITPLGSLALGSVGKTLGAPLDYPGFRHLLSYRSSAIRVLPSPHSQTRSSDLRP